MYFLVDAVVLALLGVAVWSGVKKGFTGHCLWDLLKTLISYVLAIAISVGLYFVLDLLGIMSFLADSVLSFFGNSTLGGESQSVLEIVCKILAYLPFGVVSLILGYILVKKLISLFFSLITKPMKEARHNVVWRVIDNLIALVINVAVVGGIILGCLGVLHAVNEGDNYKNIMGTDSGMPSIITVPVNNSFESAVTSAHEDVTAAPLTGFIYEINPLNDMVLDLYNSIFG